MSDGEMPEIEMNVDLDVDLGEIDMTPMLLRRFAWDTLPCAQVAEMLTALGLTHGTDEGMSLDHADSHHRMAQVFPLEGYLQRFAEILGVVTATAMLKQAGITDPDVDTVKFAEQNAEIALCASRAIIAQFVETGVLVYGPRVQLVPVGADGE